MTKAPTQQNIQQIVRALAELPGGTGTCKDLQLKFEEIAHRKGATFFACLAVARSKGWVIREGKYYILDPAGSWKVPQPSVGELLERSKRENDRLEFVAESRSEQIQELRGEIENLRDWSGGSNGTALASLLRIVSDNGATIPQRLRASGVVLAYKVEPRVSTFVQSFLESVCENDSVLADHRIFAGELLRKIEGAPRIMASIERIDPAPVADIDPAAEREQLRLEHERKVAHLERQLILDRERMEREQQRMGRPVPWQRCASFRQVVYFPGFHLC
jgi:hypothetical protein